MSTETLYQIVAIVLMVPTLFISMYYRRKANQSGEKLAEIEEGRLILVSRKVFGLILWLSVLAYMINPGWMAWARLPLPAWARWSGALILAVCIPLVYWVFSSLGKNVTPTVVTRREHVLVTHGPYRWVRHPLYSVGFTAFVGFVLLSASWFTLLLLVLTFPFLHLRTPIEEAHLVDRFGDQYKRYMQITGRYLPRLGAK
jgi:protein-S-isoprenylcysteine O-methyltransferase Ste14